MEWLKQASLQDKKGLRIISCVLKNKGTKRFRTLINSFQQSELSNSKQIVDIKAKMRNTKTDVANLLESIKSNDRNSLFKAKLEYNKSQFKTNYGIVYGRKADLTDYKDMNILKVKKFSQIQA